MVKVEPAIHAKTGIKKKIRRILGLITFVSFPVIMNYFSPYLSVSGAFEGVIAGSVFFFIAVFLSALIVGRSFCGWMCPIACFQDMGGVINSRKIPRGHWLKFIIWVPWFGFLIFGFIRPAVLPKPDFFYMTESGVSLSDPSRYVMYYFVLLVIFLLFALLGRRAFCHFGCWIAPFVIGGRKLSNLLRVPALRLQADPGKCIECGACTRACPMSLPVQRRVKQTGEGAPVGERRIAVIEQTDCVLCGECVDACPNQVLLLGWGRRK